MKPTKARVKRGHLFRFQGGKREFFPFRDFIKVTLLIITLYNLLRF